MYLLTTKKILLNLVFKEIYYVSNNIQQKLMKQKMLVTNIFYLFNLSDISNFILN